MVINIFLVLVIVLILVILLGYNKLVKQKNKVKQYESDVDIVLTKRFDLIPNIVECVKTYSEHENDTLVDLVEARNIYKQSESVNFENAEKIESKLNRVMAIAENYPDLKANTQYLDLQNKLGQIENELLKARGLYNDVVTKYNITTETIPTSIVAKIFNFEKAELFKIDENKRKNIKMSV